MDGIIQFFKNLGTVRLIIFGVVGFVTISLLFTLVGSVTQGPMEVLFTNVGQEDTARIVNTLKSRNVPHTVEAGGGIIKVPSSQAQSLRMELAEQGMSGTVPGYKELFDGENGTFGKTSFELNLNKKRALEGELAKTFKALKGVSKARVHISMPERRAFGSKQEASASIVITPARGGISTSEAQAMQAIASSSIPGLAPDRVTVVETSGRKLTDGASSKTIGGMASIEEARATKEALFRDRIETQLERVVGLGRVQANVTVEMTTSKVTENSTVYNPDSQAIVSQQLTEEKTKDVNSVGGPTTVGNQTPGANGGAGGSGTDSAKTVENTNFNNSVTKTVTVKEPGEITKINVSVLVDYHRPIVDGRLQAPQERTPAQMTILEDLVKSSIPYVLKAADADDTARDDQVVVRQLIFAEEPDIEEEVLDEKIFGMTKEDFFPIIQNFVYGIFAILLLLLVIRPLATKLIEAIPDKSQQPDPDQIENKSVMSSPILITADGQPISKEVLEAAAGGDEAASRAVIEARQSGQIVEENMGIEAKINVAQVEGRIQESAMKKVSEIIISNPEESAAIIKSWLYED